MEPDSPECRLCLDPCSEEFISMDNDELKKQMVKVFFFEILPKQGLPTRICQRCSNTISEFYQYSERVHKNQTFLNGYLKTTKIENSTVLGDVSLKTSIEYLDSAPEAMEIINIKVEPETVEEKSPNDNNSFTRSARVRQERERRESKTSSDESDDSNYSDDDIRPNRKSHRAPQTLEERAAEEQQIQKHYRMICDLCGHTEQNYKSLCQHFKKKHHRKGYVVCCQKKLTSRTLLLEHITYHTNPNAFRCDQCSKCYKSLEYLSVHKINKHSSKDLNHPFKCDECEKTFPTKRYLNRHKEVHQKIQCQVCNRVLSTTSTLSVHMSNMHSDKIRSMVCDVCGQEFLNKISFERHLNEHRGIEVQKLQCHVCKKWYRGDRNLQNHIEFSHNQKGRQIPCDVCHQSYPNERALKKHKRTVHVEEKFECEFCGKRFKQSFNLKEHRTTHTGEVLYSCDYCGVTKNSRANLYVHVKQKHTQEWAERKMQVEEANAS